MECYSLSVSRPKISGLDAFQAGTSNSAAKFRGKVGPSLKKRPAKLIIEESSESVISNSKNATVELPSEQPRIMKTRYAKMQPNLKSVQKHNKSADLDECKSSLAAVSEIPEENSIKDENKKQRQEDTEVSSTSKNSTMETLNVDAISKDPMTQSTSEINSAKTKTVESVASGKTRNRYRRVKPIY